MVDRVCYLAYCMNAEGLFWSSDEKRVRVGEFHLTARLFKCNTLFKPK